MVGLVEPSHQCHESANPRHAGYCDCGRKMFRPRDIDLEKLMMREACRGHVDPEPLLAVMQRRAGQWGPRLRVGPDWLQEALEEAPDLCNYLIWDLEDNFDAGDREELLAAIAEVASAYERVWRVREHRKENQ